MAKKSPTKAYKVITPDGNTISVEEYMKTEDYTNKLEGSIDDFMDNKTEKELIALFQTIPNQSAAARIENSDFEFAKRVFKKEEGRKPDMNNTKDMKKN